MRVTTGLGSRPEAKARMRTVVGVVRMTGLVKRSEVDVGSLPSRVRRRVVWLALSGRSRSNVGSAMRSAASVPELATGYTCGAGSGSAALAIPRHNRNKKPIIDTQRMGSPLSRYFEGAVGGIGDGPPAP